MNSFTMKTSLAAAHQLPTYFQGPARQHSKCQTERNAQEGLVLLSLLADKTGQNKHSLYCIWIRLPTTTGIVSLSVCVEDEGCVECFFALSFQMAPEWAICTGIINALLATKLTGCCRPLAHSRLGEIGWTQSCNNNSTYFPLYCIYTEIIWTTAFF